jgi:hypothetical protein
MALGMTLSGRASLSRDRVSATVSQSSYGTFGMIINFKDKTGHFNSIISQLYVRQALAHLIDQPAYIKGIFRGAAAPAYGPLPTLPKTPFTPAAGFDCHGGRGSPSQGRAEVVPAVRRRDRRCQQQGRRYDKLVPGDDPGRLLSAVLVREEVVHVTGNEWVAALARELGVEPPTAAQTDELLKLASTAAHASERAAAPLACWVAALAAATPEQFLAAAERVNAG